MIPPVSVDTCYNLVNTPTAVSFYIIYTVSTLF